MSGILRDWTEKKKAETQLNIPYSQRGVLDVWNLVRGRLRTWMNIIPQRGNEPLKHHDNGKGNPSTRGRSLKRGNTASVRRVAINKMKTKNPAQRSHGTLPRNGFSPLVEDGCTKGKKYLMGHTEAEP